MANTPMLDSTGARSIVCRYFYRADSADEHSDPAVGVQENPEFENWHSLGDVSAFVLAHTFVLARRHERDAVARINRRHCNWYGDENAKVN